MTYPGKVYVITMDNLGRVEESWFWPKEEKSITLLVYFFPVKAKSRRYFWFLFPRDARCLIWFVCPRYKKYCSASWLKLGYASHVSSFSPSLFLGYESYTKVPTELIPGEEPCWVSFATKDGIFIIFRLIYFILKVSFSFEVQRIVFFFFFETGRTRK